MEKLCLHPNPTSLWHALVYEAQQSLSISLEEELESYLVFLLMRFTDAHHITSNPMAIEWFNSLNEVGQKRQQSLRDVGDQCLIFSGLFPGIIRKTHVEASYYINIGKSAYHTLAQDPSTTLSTLFEQLDIEFVALMDVLQAARDIDKAGRKTHDLLHLTELWHEQNSLFAKQQLESQLNQTVTQFHIDNNTKH